MKHILLLFKRLKSRQMVELEVKELNVVSTIMFENIAKSIAFASILALTFVLGILSYSSCNQDIVVDANPPNAENQIQNQPYYMGHKDPRITKLPGETSSSVKYILHYNYSHPKQIWGNHSFGGISACVKTSVVVNLYLCIHLHTMLLHRPKASF